MPSTDAVCYHNCKSSLKPFQMAFDKPLVDDKAQSSLFMEIIAKQQMHASMLFIFPFYSLVMLE